MAAESNRETAAGRARHGLQADVTSGARWRRNTTTARRIRIGFAIADVDFRAGLNHRLRQCGEPDAGAGHDPQIANIDSRGVGGPALAANSADTYGELRAGAAGRNRRSLPGVHWDQPDIAAGVSRYVRGDSRLPVVAGAGVYLCGFAADRDLFWSCPGVDHGERRTGRCLARRGPFDRARRRMGAKIAGHRAGGVVACAAFGGGFAYAESAQHAQPELRF